MAKKAKTIIATNIRLLRFAETVRANKKIALRKTLLLILLLSVSQFNGQTIVNILDSEDMILNSTRKVKTIRQMFSGESKPTIYEYNEQQQLISKTTSKPNISFLFSIKWEYEKEFNRPKFRFDHRKTRFYSEKTKWEFDYEDGVLSKIRTFDLNKNFISESIIRNDSLGNPTELKSINHNGDTIAYETAKYFYTDNLVEITIYKSDGSIFGIVVKPIDKFKPITDIEIFMSSRSYDDEKILIDDWNGFKITCNTFEHKFNKIGLWTKQKHDLVFFKPSDSSFDYGTNGLLKRAYKYY
ncbi:MAG: hypothetical protein AAF090_16095 [Bacteroidota bacterium]